MNKPYIGRNFARKITNFVIVILSAANLFNPGIALANDGSSYINCQDKTVIKTKNIVSNGKVLGYIKVFRCSDGHYFTQTKNTYGDAKSTFASLIRKQPSYSASQQISGKYQSITYLVRDYSGTQCYIAGGSVRTNSYPLVASTEYSWCH